MNLSRLSLAVGVTVLIASTAIYEGHRTVFAAQEPTPTPAQTSPPPQVVVHAGPPHEMPAPINLKVLPRNLTGPQVHEIMEKWEGELGVGCKTCHAEDAKNIGPNGKPRLNFANDSKPEKETARKMFKMTEEINAKYIAKIDSSGEPVSCGTCHRGHLGPEPFAVKADHDHDHAH